MASQSTPFDPKTSNEIPTIIQMIQSLSELHENLSTALKNHTARPQSDGTSAPTQAPVDDHTEIKSGIEELQGPIESLSELPENLSTALKNHAASPQSDGTSAPTQAPVDDHTEINGGIEKLLSDIKHLKEALEKTTNSLDEKLNEPIMTIKISIEKIIKRIKEKKEIPEDFLNAISRISMAIKVLKFQIPSYHRLSLVGTTDHLIHKGTATSRQSEFKFPNLYELMSDESSAFKNIQKIYDDLTDARSKRCFLYFAVFPVNVVFKKRFLTHWWIGEELLEPLGSGDQTPEALAGEVLKKFAEKGLIVPVKEEQKKVKKRFRMPPLVRSAAIKLAMKDKFLNYDFGGNPTGITEANTSGCDRIFLVKGGGSHRPKAPTENQNLEKTVKTIFNVSQPFPDSALEWLAKEGKVDMRTVKVVKWLLKLENLKVLYLGRWQSAVDEQQIEVESLEFLRGLKKMKKLRLLSLQGISWIDELPNSIGSLNDLRVLDLKSCFNLEKLPRRIGSLKNLTHLDVSGCYMLKGMPKTISALTELRVLKGFVTGRSSLNDLKGLKKLRKLSINTSRQAFPNENDLRVLIDLGEHGALRNLAIAWGAKEGKQPSSSEQNIEQHISKKSSEQNIERHISKKSSEQNLELPEQLEKLEMECLPEKSLPSWLNPSKLKSLKRLYIRGGKLAGLGKPWMAEVVRLKYLTELEIEWKELNKCFPHLSYLQRVKCPRVTFCPCNAYGVWVKPGQ